jgi:hypothetical protein
MPFHWVVFLLGGCVILSVYVHLGVLNALRRLVLPRLRSMNSLAVASMVLGAIVGHLLEIGVFAVGVEVLYAYGLTEPGATELFPNRMHPFYVSAAAFTSLGAGPPPTDELRLFTPVEALTGLILITWTASFLFLVMQKFWGKEIADPTPPR